MSYRSRLRQSPDEPLAREAGDVGSLQTSLWLVKQETSAVSRRASGSWSRRRRHSPDDPLARGAGDVGSLQTTLWLVEPVSRRLSGSWSRRRRTMHSDCVLRTRSLSQRYQELVVDGLHDVSEGRRRRCHRQRTRWHYAADCRLSPTTGRRRFTPWHISAVATPSTRFRYTAAIQIRPTEPTLPLGIGVVPDLVIISTVMPMSPAIVGRSQRAARAVVV